MKSWRKKRKKAPFASRDTFYDLDFDKATIESSIWAQYHIPPHEQEDLTVPEYLRAIGGLKADSLLSQIVQIRSEKNPDRIKHFGPAERKIRSEWQAFLTKKETEMTGRQKQEYQQKRLIEELRFQDAMKSICRIKTK